MHAPSFQWILVHILVQIVLFASCLIIFFKTKEIYELSKHLGIKYFRLSFLFFGLTFLIKTFDMILPILGMSPIIQEYRGILFLLISLIEGVALIFLLSSLFSKQITLEKILIINIIFFISWFFCLFFVSRGIFYLVNSLLFLISLITIITKLCNKKKKKFTSLYILYLTLILFLIVTNILDYIFLTFPLWNVIAYTLTGILFFIMLFKILNKIKK